MIVNPDVTTYIHSLEKEPPALFESLRTFAAQNDVPIIRREMESFIKVLLEMKKPERILEIGAGIAYSTLFMAFNTPEETMITTIENYGPRIAEAEKNIKESGMNGRITLIADDAANVLKTLEGPFDFIFLDAAKGQYMAFLPEITRLLPKGGILLSDNVLQEGDLVRSRYATPRRQRTIHERMREFVRELKHSEDYDTSVITIGDGVTLSIKK